MAFAPMLKTYDLLFIRALSGRHFEHREVSGDDFLSISTLNPSFKPPAYTSNFVRAFYILTRKRYSCGLIRVNNYCKGAVEVL